MTVVALTGPTGSGKTTLAEALAKKLTTYVNIDVDPIKHMNPNAFTKVIDGDGEEDWPYSAWGLLGENIALLAENYMKHGHDVIINGWLEVESWQEIDKRIKIDHKVLILPEISINIERDSGRNEEVKMDEKAVARGQSYFNNTDYYADFTKIDTSTDTVDETAAKIIEIISYDS